MRDRRAPLDRDSGSGQIPLRLSRAGTRPEAAAAGTAPLRFWGALLLVALWSGEACAHASLIRSEPADRAVVAQAPRVITLTFNEPVAPLLARLLSPAGETTALADVKARDQTLTIALPDT